MTNTWLTRNVRVWQEQGLKTMAYRHMYNQATNGKAKWAIKETWRKHWRFVKHSSLENPVSISTNTAHNKLVSCWISGKSSKVLFGFAETSTYRVSWRGHSNSLSSIRSCTIPTSDYSTKRICKKCPTSTLFTIWKDFESRRNCNKLLFVFVSW